MLHSRIRPITIVVVVCILLVSPSLPSFSNYKRAVPIADPIEDPSATPAYSSHSPITITSDSDFEAQGWPGEGSSSSPYLISNLNITTESAVCLLIVNTSRHFTVRDCWFSSGGSEWRRGIITLENVVDGQIDNNVFAVGHIAMYVEDSSSCTFTANIIGTSLMGFQAYNLVDSDFSGNSQISESIGYSVHVEDSTNVDITNNFFQDSLYEGIGLTSCSDCYVAFNVLSGTNLHNGQYGFALRNSIDCTVTQNNVTSFGTAIDITDGQMHTISENYINACWGGVIIRGNNMTVSNNDISVTGFSIQLRDAFSITVNENVLRGTIYAIGVDIIKGGNSQITDNTISELEYGMIIEGSVNVEVSDNRFSECYVAISLEELLDIGYGIVLPVNCRILNNQLEGCGFGFSITNPVGMNHEISGNIIDGRPVRYLYGATNLQIDGREYGQIILADCEDISITGGMLDELLLMFCTNCEISGVSIINRTNGIYIRYSSQIAIGYSQLVGNDVGIRVERSSYCHIISITAHNNGHGLLLDSSPNSTIYDCDLYDNKYGMVLIGADQSYIESNRVHDNNQGIFLLRTWTSFIGNNDVLDNDETGLLLNRGSRFNTIVANSFGWNRVNVLCTGFDNIWDDGVKRGNSWSDLGESTIYMIDEDDFDRFPKSLWVENSTTVTESTTTSTNSTEVPETVTVAMGAVAGFSIIGLTAIAMHFAKRREPA